MRGTRVLIATAALLMSALAANAQGQEQDPSSRVLRASYLHGQVSFRPGNVDDWTSATLNYPLSSGDHLWTDVDSRAELHLGSNAIRLAPETAFEILDLDDRHLQIRLTQGSALIRIRSLYSNDNVEIDTPTGAVSLLQNGTYRVDVSADGATSTVTTRNGDAEVTSNDNVVPVGRNESVLFTADGSSPDVRDAYPMDEYDQWANDRDRVEDRSVSARYVSRDMTGYEDLDNNGTWSDNSEYGHVWVPSHVASNWAPYRYGRWVWVEPYGWTWIDDAPWGFAPFHYGRWAYADDRWAWCPGAIVSRPVYAPALVVFVGGSSYDDRYYRDRGDVEWFPLAPREIYRPVYRTSDDYVRRVNVTNVNITNINITNVNITNIQYRNQRVQGATTAVSQDQFAGSRRIGGAAVIVPVSEARNAHVVGYGAPVAPTEQSVLIRRQGAQQVSRPPQSAQTRQVVWKNTPPPSPATFASHAAQLQTSGNRPVAPLPISQTRGAPRSTMSNGTPRTNGPATLIGSQNTRPNINVRSQPNDEAVSAGRRNGVPMTQPTAPQPNLNVRPSPARQPNLNVRPAPAPNPNENVRPAATTQQNERIRPTPAPQPNENVRPSAPPSERIRPAPAPQPNVDSRPAPPMRSSTNDRPMSRVDGPSPVNGSANGSPAHTVAQPNPNARSASAPQYPRPAARPEVQQPQRSAPQEERRSPAQGERPQDTRPQDTRSQDTRTPPPRAQSSRSAPVDNRRAAPNDRPSARNDKSMRRP